MQAIELYDAHLSAGGPPIKFAFVGMNPKPWAMDEEMGKNYGVEVLVTYDYQKAIAWLESDSKAT
jgi:hypothetical protein